MEESFVKIRNDVLTANTAQGVYKYLQGYESNRARILTRWIWELLQNARDASSGEDTSLIASIRIEPGEVRFQHNGRGFTKSEIAHLIFHGSTKVEESETIGKFGSGFLTTHLLSPEINVSGQLDEGGTFDFHLKRESVSVDALRESMNESWIEFRDSLSSPTESLSDDNTTQFRYPIKDNASDVVEAGIATLKLCAPFVVVFNREFYSIRVESPDEASSFEAVSRLSLNEELLQEITVAESENDIRRERKYILANGEKASVAIPLESAGDGRDCLTLDNIPRLFLGFPLIGTENFSFPAVINSFKFTPTENRDGVFLGQSENESNLKNQTVIEEACELHVKLIHFVAESGWRNNHALANIPPIPEPNWLNNKWIRGCLKRFIEQIYQTPAVLCGHSPITPKDSVLPFSEEDSGVEPLWDLMNEVGEFRQRLPERYEAIGWCSAIKGWAVVRQHDVTCFDEAIDGRKLASYVAEKTKIDGEEWGTLDNLQILLSEEICAVDWLNRLYGFLNANGFYEVTRHCSFIVDQDGYLDVLSNLHRDKDIDDELKDIADCLLGLGIRQKLRDNQLTSLAGEVGKGDLENKDVLHEIIVELKELDSDNDLSDKFVNLTNS